MGPDPQLKYGISALVIINIASAYFISNVAGLSYFWTTVAAYCFAGFINHRLFIGIHDVSHNTAFGASHLHANHIFGLWANLPMGVPMFATFKKYHTMHHRYLATDGWDTDLPTDIEGRFFSNPPLKILFIMLYPFLYGLRPLIVHPLPVTVMEVVNFVVQILFDCLLVYFCGFKALYYLVVATFMCMGLHPMAAHFIAEHYMFERGYETYSYYGPWNIPAWNMGYHMEHHDFPYIPCSKLPEVKRIASEFYDNLPQHTTWFGIWWDFIFSPSLGPYSRVKRNYSEVYGDSRSTNPYLGADNSMKPVGFKKDD